MPLRYVVNCTECLERSFVHTIIFLYVYLLLDMMLVHLQFHHKSNLNVLISFRSKFNSYKTTFSGQGSFFEVPQSLLMYSIENKSSSACM